MIIELFNNNSMTSCMVVLMMFMFMWLVIFVDFSLGLVINIAKPSLVCRGEVRSFIVSHSAARTEWSRCCTIAFLHSAQL